VLYLQARTDIIGMHPNRGRFSQELVKRAESLDVAGSFANVGVWEFVGLTGRWSRVLAMYELREDWMTVTDQIAQIMRTPPPELAQLYQVADTMRSGGIDDILEPLPGCPSVIAADAGPLLVHDELEVASGTEEAYAERLMSDWVPITQAHGHELLGIYRNALADGQVTVQWATDLSGYRSLAGTAAMKTWHRDDRARRSGWRQELWTAAPGSKFSVRPL
jgi:hypothetical protein